MVKKYLLILLIALVSVSALAAEGVENIEISPNPVGLGDLFSLTIVLDHPSSDDVEFSMKELPKQLTLWRGPYTRTFIDSGNKGETRRKVRITTTFKALSSGRMIIPELSITAGGKVLKTKPLLLRVGLYKNRKLYMPLEVEWRPAFEDVYAGEAVPLFLIVQKQEVVSLFDRIRVAIPRDGYFEKAEGLGEINQLGEGNLILYDIPVAAYIFTSPVPGEVKIPAAGVDSGGITGWTDILSLKILPVPGQISATGAIGDFDFNTSVNSSEISAGKNIILTSVVNGRGNLNYLQIPEPEAGGCILISRIETDDFARSLSGYSGSKTVVWTFNAMEAGISEITTPDFSFLNKETGIIETIPEKTHRINVIPAAIEPEAADEEGVHPFSGLDSELDTSREWRDYYKGYINYIWLLPAAVFFLMSRLLKGRRNIVALVITLIIMVSAVSLIRSFAGPWNAAAEGRGPADYYNRAAGMYDDGNLTGSLHNLRTAVYSDPMNKMFYETLNALEEQNGYLSAVSPSVQLHPDLFFYILIGAVNFFFLAAFLKSIKPGALVSVAYIMSAFVILCSSGLIVYNHLSRTSLTGIVAGSNVYIKKIPRKSAENWLLMRPGTSVKIIDGSDDFLLIETGMGVKGWIEHGLILEDRPE
ncbi:MAG: BatD family protein [Spirochaetales bacterium]|nr:BatD family protein [Spirochaetales bacterium]